MTLNVMAVRIVQWLCDCHDIVDLCNCCRHYIHTRLYDVNATVIVTVIVLHNDYDIVMHFFCEA